MRGWLHAPTCDIDTTFPKDLRREAVDVSLRSASLRCTPTRDCAQTRARRRAFATRSSGVATCVHARRGNLRRAATARAVRRHGARRRAGGETAEDAKHPNPSRLRHAAVHRASGEGSLTCTRRSGRVRGPRVGPRTSGQHFNVQVAPISPTSGVGGAIEPQVRGPDGRHRAYGHRLTAKRL